MFLGYREVASRQAWDRDYRSVYECEEEIWVDRAGKDWGSKWHGWFETKTAVE